jgi:ornithine cyclodeaminase
LRLLVLDDAAIRRLLPMRECLPLMAHALSDLARGRVEQPLRIILRPESLPGLMAFMPAYRAGAPGAFGVKIVGVFHGNAALGKDAHPGAVLLLSAETGEPLAIMNASAITAIRTAAVSGVATELLALPNAGDLAIIGSGVQARTHLEAMVCARRLRRVRVAARSRESAERFASQMSGHSPVPIEAVTSAEAAVRGADLVVTATNAAEPVLRREWIEDGAHLNVVGASLPSRREVDTATMAAARLFADRRESMLNEAGDYILAAGEGAIGPESIRGELGEILLGERLGRTTPEQITLFKSLGLAIEDLASAQYLFERAKNEGAGSWVDL